MNLTFASPEWLWCLLLLLPLALLRFWSQIRGAKGAPGLVSPRLTSELIVGATQWKRWVIFSIQLAALALLLLAMARPQRGFEEAEIESEGRNVFVAIDTSRSMLARDLLPDRITRARLAAQDIVNALPADRIGLIAFAGKAFLQAPLTVDHDAVLETIQQFDTELVPRGGTNLASAVTLAIETLEKAESVESALILFSDGENLEGEEELKSLRERAENVGLVLVAIGVGTETGELIPKLDDRGRPKPGEFVKDDESSSVVRSRLNPTALKELSLQIGGGVYVNLGATASISDVVEKSIRQIEGVREKGESRRQPIERFMWPLSASMVFLMIAWLLPGTLRLLAQLFGDSRSGRRRTPPPLPGRPKRAAASGAGAAVLAAALIAPGLASAQNASAKARESAAFAALQRNAYDSAIEAYERELAGQELKADELAWLNLGLGSAAYKTGDFEKAKLAFGKALEYPANRRIETQAHHNLGNALFRTGEKLLEGPDSPNPNLPQPAGSADKELVAKQWRGAIEHYQAALQADSGNQSSRHNLSVVQKRLEILMEKPPEEEEKEDEEDEDEDEQEQEKQEDQKGEGEDQEDEPKDPNQEPEDKPEDPNENQDKPEDPDNQGDNQGKPDDPKDDPKRPPENGNKPPGKPDQPPEPREPDPDGKLEADEQPKDGLPPGQPPEPAEVNPETGFSPEEARQKLRQLSDEDLEVRPAVRLPIRAERFKNW